MQFTREKDVESYYRHALQYATKQLFQSPQNTDGVLEWGNTRLLLEAKLNGKLLTTQGKSKALAQAVYYMKALDQKPTVILIGDREHYFTISATKLSSFTNLSDVDWGCAPSTPCPNLVSQISESEQISEIFIESLPMNAEAVKSYAESLGAQKTQVTPKNLPKVFTIWSERVCSKQVYPPATQADLFLATLCHTHSKDVFVHPTEPNTLIVNGSSYRIDVHALQVFFSRYEQGYSPSQIDAFMEMRDTLLEEENRRRQGAFFTQSIWANEAINLLDEQLGENWRDDCIVWDCCAGTANLTRNHDFRNLILSTAEKSDVDAIEREEYNFGAEVFQFDFLNPDSESPFFGEGEENRLPRRVRQILERGAQAGKRLVFLINPPYAEDGDVKLSKIRNKKGVASNLVSKTMPKLGRANRQLYSQFLYQCDQIATEYGFKEKTIGVFCKPAFMTSGAFSKFRAHWYARFAYVDGFMFKASHFADVSGAWGVSFTLWNSGTTNLNQDLQVALKDKLEDSISTISHKLLYNADGKKASDWVAPKSHKFTSAPSPKFSSGLSQAAKESDERGLTEEALGVFVNKANCPQQNQIVLLLSSLFSDKGSKAIPILSNEDWRRSIALFSARKLVSPNWVNDKDEYLAPLTEAEGYNQWVDDCHVYALLQSSNNMTAMRDIAYRDKLWNIHNHFFWLTRSQALEIFDTRDSAQVFRDCQRSSHEPHFAQILPSLKLSPLAQEILNDLTTILKESLALRKTADQDLHLGAWDAGAYQLNKLLKDTPSWDALKAKHRKLRDSLIQGVYTYGFLKP